MNPFAARTILGASAITDTGGSVAFLIDFLTNYSVRSAMSPPCVIDFIPVHWYGEWWNLDSFYSFLYGVKGVVENVVGPKPNLGDGGCGAGWSDRGASLVILESDAADARSGGVGRAVCVFWGV
jgi:hypothetical protein